jgi:hypothetical protein
MKVRSKLHPLNGSILRGLAAAAIALALSAPCAFALSQTPQSAAPNSQAGAISPPARAAAAPTPVAGDIRDIRGPVHIPSPWLWYWWLAAAAALAAMAYGIWRWRRRRTRAATPLPYQIALARLEKARALMQPENAREFSIEVSEIVRHYIEARFEIRAARRTTEEFLRDLLDPSLALLANHRASLADFLGHCDLAKFARWILPAGVMATMLESARSFVLETGRPASPAGTSDAHQPPASLPPPAPPHKPVADQVIA